MSGHQHVIPPRSGYALVVKRGQRLRLTDLEGQQVIDMTLYNEENPREKLSTSNSRTRYRPKPGQEYFGRDHLLAGDTLMSTLCRPMLTILEETAEPPGVHDFHNRMCNRYLYESFGVGPKDGCHEIIAAVVAPYGIAAEDIPDPMNVFMNYAHNCETRRWELKQPVTRPGDYIEFRAEMDCIVGMSNCPAEGLISCNGEGCTPVKVDVFA